MVTGPYVRDRPGTTEQVIRPDSYFFLFVEASLIVFYFISSYAEPCMASASVCS